MLSHTVSTYIFDCARTVLAAQNFWKGTFFNVTKRFLVFKFLLAVVIGAVYTAFAHKLSFILPRFNAFSTQKYFTSVLIALLRIPNNSLANVAYKTIRNRL